MSIENYIVESLTFSDFNQRLFLKNWQKIHVRQPNTTPRSSLIISFMYTFCLLN